MIDWFIVWDRCICTNSYVSFYFSNLLFGYFFWLGNIAWRIRRSGRVGWFQYSHISGGTVI
jgi:hypothetical protein